MLITSMFYTRAEQPMRISIWYAFNGLGVSLGGLLGYAIGHIKVSFSRAFMLPYVKSLFRERWLHGATSSSLLVLSAPLGPLPCLLFFRTHLLLPTGSPETSG